MPLLGLAESTLLTTISSMQTTLRPALRHGPIGRSKCGIPFLFLPLPVSFHGPTSPPMKKHANRVNLGSRILNAKETDRLQRIHERKIQEARKKGVPSVSARQRQIHSGATCTGTGNIPSEKSSKRIVRAGTDCGSRKLTPSSTAASEARTASRPSDENLDPQYEYIAITSALNERQR